jgi:hypothetical protein
MQRLLSSPFSADERSNPLVTFQLDMRRRQLQRISFLVRSPSGPQRIAELSHHDGLRPERVFRRVPTSVAKFAEIQSSGTSFVAQRACHQRRDPKMAQDGNSSRNLAVAIKLQKRKRSKRGRTELGNKLQQVVCYTFADRNSKFERTIQSHSQHQWRTRLLVY